MVDDVREGLKPTPEDKPQLSEFTHFKTGIIYSLIQSEAIKLHPELQGKPPINAAIFKSEEAGGKFINAYVLDIHKAMPILEHQTSRIEALEPELPQGREGEILALSQQAFKQAVKAMVMHGDLPTQLAIETGKLIRPSNVTITDENYLRFLYIPWEFPLKPEERADLEVGLRNVFSTVETYSQILAEHGVELTEEQMLRLVLRAGITHEYGHAVDRALLFLKVGEHVVDIAEESDKSSAYHTSYADISNVHHQNVYEQIAPNIELLGLLKGEPDNGYYGEGHLTSSERIGRGFQFLGLEYALRDLGINEIKIDPLLDAFKDSGREPLADYKRLIRGLRSYNLNIEIVSSAINDLKVTLRRSDRADLVDKTLPFGFSARDLGYYYPLSKDEIRVFTHSFSSKPTKAEELTQEAIVETSKEIA